MYSSSSVSCADRSSPKFCSPSEALWSTSKHVATINRVRNHCPRAMEKFRRRLTPSGADRISTSAIEGAPVPEATIAYWSTVRKFLRGQADRYAMVASGTGAPSLANVEILSAPDGVTLPRNFSIARGQWLRTRLIVATCFGVHHNALDGLQNFGEELLAQETELEEFIP